MTILLRTVRVCGYGTNRENTAAICLRGPNPAVSFIDSLLTCSLLGHSSSGRSSLLPRARLVSVCRCCRGLFVLSGPLFSSVASGRCLFAAGATCLSVSWISWSFLASVTDPSNTELKETHYDPKHKFDFHISFHFLIAAKHWLKNWTLPTKDRALLGNQPLSKVGAFGWSVRGRGHGKWYSTTS